MEGEEAEDGVGVGVEVAVYVAAPRQSWIQKSPVERTFIRPGAAGKLEPPPRRRPPRDRGAEGEAGVQEAAAAAEAE